MGKLEPPGVERMPIQQHGVVAISPDIVASKPGTTTVQPIGQDGRNDVGQVQADLMRTPRMWSNPECCKPSPTFHKFIESARRTTRHMTRADRHLLALIGMNANRCINDVTVAFGNTNDNGKV